MKVILISGKMQHGKDTFGEMIKKRLLKNEQKSWIIHYGDYLKFFLKEYYGWDGEKNKNGRRLLQLFGTEIIRKEDPDFWVDLVARVVYATRHNWDYVIIPDVRMKNEIERFYDFFDPADIITVRIERKNIDNTTYLCSDYTSEQHNHESEVALDDYIFNYTIENRTLTELEESADVLVEELINS